MNIFSKQEEELEQSGYFYKLDPDPGPRSWTLKNLDPENPAPWKTSTLKNLDLEKHGKGLDMEKWLEEHIS